MSAPKSHSMFPDQTWYETGKPEILSVPRCKGLPMQAAFGTRTSIICAWGSNCCTIQTWTPDMLWKISFNMPGLSMYEELILRPLLVTKTGQAPSRQRRATPSIRNILKCLHFQNDQKSCTVTIDCLPSSCVPAFPILRHSSASSLPPLSS